MPKITDQDAGKGLWYDPKHSENIVEICVLKVFCKNRFSFHFKCIFVSNSFGEKTNIFAQLFNIVLQSKIITLLFLLYLEWICITWTDLDPDSGLFLVQIRICIWILGNDSDPTEPDPDPVPGQQHCIIGSGKKETGTKYYFCQVPGSCEGWFTKADDDLCIWLRDSRPPECGHNLYWWNVWHLPPSLHAALHSAGMLFFWI